MVGVLELMRLPHIAFAALAALAGCSSSGPDVVVSAITDGWRAGGAGEEADDLATSITRAQVERLGVAMIRTRTADASDANLLVALRRNGPQILYVLRADRRLVLHGGLIQSTEGFGDNLEPIAVNPEDPVAFPRRLSDWPERIRRVYTVSRRGPGTPVTVVCDFNKGTAGTIEIVGQRHEIVEVDETCTGPGIAFTNQHHVAPATGEFWASLQWTGPVQGALFYEVLEPLTP
jgi:hypothetical protein